MKKVHLVSICFVMCIMNSIFAGGSTEDSSKPIKQAALGPSATTSAKNEEYVQREKELSQNLVAALESKDIFQVISSWDMLSSHLATSAILPSNPSEKIIEYQREINELLDSVSIKAVKTPNPTIAGRSFTSAFTVKILTIDEGSQEIPLGGIPLTVICPVKNLEGEKSFFSESITSTTDGLVSFTAPVPPSSINDVVVFQAFFSGDDPWLQANLENRRDSGQLQVKIPYKVETAKKSVPTTISILDFDKNGRPVMYNNVTATALLMPMVQKGFTRIGMADFQQQLGAGDEAGLLRAAKNQFGSAVDRFIFGTTKISSLAKADDGMWVCTIATEVSVWIFSENRKVFSVNFTHTERGATEAASLDAARKKNATEKLLAELLFNL